MPEEHPTRRDTRVNKGKKRRARVLSPGPYYLVGLTSASPRPLGSPGPGTSFSPVKDASRVARGAGGRSTRGGWALLVARAMPVVEPLPIVLASRLIGDPGLEIGTGGVRV